MSRSRVVEPNMVRLPLSDGDFIDVKSELNAGEYVDLLTDQGKGMYFAKVLHYLIGWSLVGVNGPLPFSLDMPASERMDTIRGLDVETARELVKAVDVHEDAQEKARTKKKKSRDTSSASSPISTSAVQ